MQQKLLSSGGKTFKIELYQLKNIPKFWAPFCDDSAHLLVTKPHFPAIDVS